MSKQCVCKCVSKCRVTVQVPLLLPDSWLCCTAAHLTWYWQISLILACWPLHVPLLTMLTPSFSFWRRKHCSEVMVVTICLSKTWTPASSDNTHCGSECFCVSRLHQWLNGSCRAEPEDAALISSVFLLLYLSWTLMLSSEVQLSGRCGHNGLDCSICQ